MAAAAEAAAADDSSFRIVNKMAAGTRAPVMTSPIPINPVDPKLFCDPDPDQTA